MAMNLRLRPDAEEALREFSVRTGRSQQELIREAVDRLLATAATTTEHGDLLAQGILKPARTPYRRAARLVKLPEGVSSLDLLDREDRF
ncbi:hypothetical protein [Salinibacterium sp. GXW1014]|uniref:hypothetical protein n=1 Tax=Salinibacterium sp. GXW1014 TaxID=3377838 RepID=UPI00383BF07F